MVERSVDGLNTYKKLFKLTNNKFLVYPEEIQCENCETDLELISIQTNGVILFEIPLACEIFKAVCSCGNEYFFKGEKDGFVNFTNKFIVPVEVISKCLNFFCANGMPMNSFLDNFFIKPEISIDLVPETAKNFIITNFRGKLHSAFAETVEYLELEFVKCCDVSKITMDGIVLSVKVSELPPQQNLFTRPIIKDRATQRMKRQLPHISENDYNVIHEILSKKRTADEILIETWSNSDHIGLQCLSYGFNEKMGFDSFFVQFAASLSSKKHQTVCPAKMFLHPICDNILNE